MIRPDDETLMRWSDGELPQEEAARLEAAALADPDLAARMSDLRRLRKAAREAFPAAVDPHDRDLARLIAGAPERRPSPLAGAARRLVEVFAPRRVAAWGALATAAFVVGVLLRPSLEGDDGGLRVAADGTLQEARLVRVLDDRLAAEGPDDAGRAVGLTFRDGEGRWCRTFQARSEGMAGLACREQDNWQIKVLAPLGSVVGEVRTAASDTPEAVLAAVEAVIVGDTADREAEAKARDGGWRRQ